MAYWHLHILTITFQYMTRLLVLPLIGLLIAVFAIINNEVVSVNYLLGQMNLSLFMVILGSSFAGALFIGFLSVFRSIHNYMKSQGDRDYKKELERRVKVLDSENVTLEAELDKQQKEREDAAMKAYEDLENEKKELEEMLRKNMKKEHEDIIE